MMKDEGARKKRAEGGNCCHPERSLRRRGDKSPNAAVLLMECFGIKPLLVRTRDRGAAPCEAECYWRSLNSADSVRDDSGFRMGRSAAAAGAATSTHVHLRRPNEDLPNGAMRFMIPPLLGISITRKSKPPEVWMNLIPPLTAI